MKSGCWSLLVCGCVHGILMGESFASEMPMDAALEYYAMIDAVFARMVLKPRTDVDIMRLNRAIKGPQDLLMQNLDATRTLPHRMRSALLRVLGAEIEARNAIHSGLEVKTWVEDKLWAREQAIISAINQTHTATQGEGEGEAHAATQGGAHTATRGEPVTAKEAQAAYKAAWAERVKGLTQCEYYGNYLVLANDLQSVRVRELAVVREDLSYKRLRNCANAKCADHPNCVNAWCASAECGEAACEDTHCLQSKWLGVSQQHFAELEEADSDTREYDALLRALQTTPKIGLFHLFYSDTPHLMTHTLAKLHTLVAAIAAYDGAIPLPDTIPDAIRQMQKDFQTHTPTTQTHTPTHTPEQFTHPAVDQLATIVLETLTTEYSEPPSPPARK